MNKEKHKISQEKEKKVNKPEAIQKKIKSEEFDAKFREATEQYMLGLGGNKDAVKSANDLYTALYAFDPKNHLVEAYLGSATALIGRDAVSPVEKFKNTNNGLKLLDHAVLSEPENIQIRVLRANVCLNLPEMYFHRSSMAVEDFMLIASAYEKDDTALPQEIYWKALYNIGSGFKAMGYLQDAHEVWRKLLSVTQDPSYKELLVKEGYKGR